MLEETAGFNLRIKKNNNFIYKKKNKKKGTSFYHSKKIDALKLFEKKQE